MGLKEELGKLVGCNNYKINKKKKMKSLLHLKNLERNIERH